MSYEIMRITVCRSIRDRFLDNPVERLPERGSHHLRDHLPTPRDALLTHLDSATSMMAADAR